MGFFSKIIAPSANKKQFSLGSPEAEGESTQNSTIKLSEVFEDYLQVLSELDHEKFIMIGRKGSGKSAYAQHIYSNSCTQIDNSDYFCKIIRTNTIDMEKIVQKFAVESSVNISSELFKWVIFTQMINLFLDHKDFLSPDIHDNVNKFLKKNSGYVDIDKNEIVSVLKESESSVSIEYLKRFCAKKGITVNIKEEKAPFYKIIPSLEIFIQTILKENLQRNLNFKYCIIFDDLDIGFKVSSIENKESLANLLRVAKYFNNDFFNKRNSGNSSKEVKYS